MDGYVIAFKTDVDNESMSYWDSTNEVKDLDQSLFIDSLIAARQTAGTLQTQFTDREVVVLAASKGVQLKSSVSTSSSASA